MGYFSNGEEGRRYMADYCERCINWRDKGDGRGEGCPIMDLHLLWNYDAVGKDRDKTKQSALEMFIPRDADGWNGDCAMFQLPKVPTQRELEQMGQLRIL